MHGVFYSPQAEAARAFIGEKLGFPHVDTGDGWLIFNVPQAEFAVHPGDDTHHEITFWCDEIEGTIAELQERGVVFKSPVADQGWGRVTRSEMPGGVDVMLYEPKHPQPWSASPATSIHTGQGSISKMRTALYIPTSWRRQPMNELLGAWSLTSFEMRRSDGRVSFPFGEDPSGMLLYEPSGRMSAQLLRRDRPPFDSGDQLMGDASEIKSAFQGCIAYFGAFEVDEAAATVVHRVEGSLFPNWIGTEQVRYYELDRDRLTIKTAPTEWDGVEVVAVLVWRRLG